MSSFPLLISAVALGCVTGQGSSDIVWDLISSISGVWSNRAQIQAESTEHDLYESRLLPVYSPALLPKAVFILEDVVNGKIVTLNLMVVTRDDKDKNIVYTTPYNFTNSRKYKPGELRMEDVYHLTLADLSQETQCVHSYVRLGQGVFSGTYFVCGQTIGGQHPAIGLTVTCDAITMTIPLSVPVRPTSVPYVFRLVGSRYPLLNTPNDYVSPCIRMN